MRKSNIPPGGSIPRGIRHAGRHQHSYDIDDTAPWKPHVIDRKPAQKHSSSSARNTLTRRVLESVLAQIQQEFADQYAMASTEGEKFNIGFPQYFSMLTKRMADLSAEIKKLS